jgi:hypothetical protein
MDLALWMSIGKHFPFVQGKGYDGSRMEPPEAEL